MKSLFALLLVATQLQASAFALPIHSKGKALDAALADILMSANYNFEGIVKLDNCSGALVRFAQSKDSDKGMMLTNGHCYSAGAFGGFIEPNAYVMNKKAVRSVKFLNSDGSLKSGSISTTQVLYATMTGTDAALYELDSTYEQIKSKFSVNALTLDSKRSVAGQEIEILSGYWQRGYACQIEKFIPTIKEDAYTWKDSLKYSKTGCETIHGTSGSPILSRNTGLVVGINNTGNDNGERCTMDNPCEVGTNGEITVEKGRSYGQQTYIFYTCLNLNGKIDLSMEGCLLHH